MSHAINNLWKDLALLGERGILDPADVKGLKNKYIDLTQKIALRREIKFSRNDKILDFGCGPGRLTFWFARLKVAEVTGIDITPDMIENAKEKLSRLNFDNIKFLTYDGHKVPFNDGYFDKICTVGVLSLILEENSFQDMIEELSRVLKKGGLFFFIEHISGVKILEKYHNTDYNYKVLRTIDDYIKVFKGKGLKLIKYYPINGMNGIFFKKYIIPRKLHFWTKLIPYLGVKFDLWRARSSVISSKGYSDCLFIFEKL